MSLLTTCRRPTAICRVARFAATAFFLALAARGLAQSRLTSLSLRTDITAQAPSVAATFSITGTTSKTVLVRAVGPSLSLFGIPGTLTDPQLVVTNAGGVTVASNDNWGGDQAVTNTFVRIGAFSLSAGSRDAALVSAFAPGTYTVTVSGVGGATGGVLLEVYEADLAANGTSFARLAVRAAGMPLVAGVTVNGPLPVLLRALGPALTGMGVAGAVDDPRMALFSGSAVVASNDNWGNDTALSAAAASVGATPLAANSRDSALLATLTPGGTSVQVMSAGSSTGVAQIEVFSLADISLAPAITAQPAGTTVAVGSPLTLSVAATGTPAPTYQWQKNGAAIASATGATYTVASAQSSDSGTYTVVVSNTGGSVTSAPAVVAVTSGIAPAIATHPASTTLSAGSRLMLTVVAVGLPEPSYQWQKNGVAIAGATAASYTVASVQPGDTGAYTVIVSNGLGSVTSAAATVVVNAAAPPVITTQPQSQSAVIGRSVTLSVAGSGLPPPTYQWFKDGLAVPGATGVSYTIAAVEAAHAGSYTVRLANPGGTITSAAAVVTVLPSALLSNLSVRTSMTDGQQLAVGMFVTGGARNVLLRAAGPALGALGLSSVVADPRMALFNARGVQVLANDDWDASLAPTFTRVGAFAFPAGSRDAAVAQSVEGQLSVQITAGGAGTLLVEAYDLDSGSATRLINLSALSRVGTGDNVLIAGFNLSGTGTKRLLIRGVGPSLAPLGVGDVLADPRLEIFNGNDVRVGLNDTWSVADAPLMQQAGAFALLAGSRDAALVLTLPVGSYSAVLSGADGGSGMGIIELYELP